MRLSDEQFKSEVLARKNAVLATRKRQRKIVFSALSVVLVVAASLLAFNPLYKELFATKDEALEDEATGTAKGNEDSTGSYEMLDEFTADDVCADDCTDGSPSYTASQYVNQTASKSDNLKGQASDTAGAQKSKLWLTVEYGGSVEKTTDRDSKYIDFFRLLNYSGECDCQTVYTVNTHYGEYLVNLEKRCVKHEGKSVHLTDSEYELLSTLLKGE